jgi:hypothetical protein
MTIANIYDLSLKIFTLNIMHHSNLKKSIDLAVGNHDLSDVSEKYLLGFDMYSNANISN